MSLVLCEYPAWMRPASAALPPQCRSERTWWGGEKSLDSGSPAGVHHHRQDGKEELGLAQRPQHLSHLRSQRAAVPPGV